MILTVQDLFNQFMSFEYKWYVLGGVLLLIVFIIILCIPKKKKAEKKLDKVEKTEEPKQEEVKTEEVKVEEKTPIEEVKEETPIEEVKEETPVEEVKEETPVEEKVEEETKTEEPKQEEVKEEQPKEEQPKVEQPKVVGKWIIKRKSPEDFVLNLVANNGEVIYASESYANIAGAKLGLLTIKKNIGLNHFQIHSDKNNHYFFKLKDSANKLIGMGQVYTTKRSCQSSINSVKKFAQDSELSADAIDEMTYTKYEPKESINVDNIKDAYRGKWIIAKNEAEFQARLYASNGEVLLVTERYASTNSVYNAIDTIKKNVENNNFIIDCDKNKKYFYRLRNVNKLTLAIGEAYDKQLSCINSIESVKRFCLTADIIENLEEKEEEKK